MAARKKVFKGILHDIISGHPMSGMAGIVIRLAKGGTRAFWGNSRMIRRFAEEIAVETPIEIHYRDEWDWQVVVLD